MKILWVENHAAFVKVAGDQFLSEHELTVVDDVASAKELLESQTFDALLVDYDLEDGKGDAVIRHLRLLGKQVPTIAVSSREEGNNALIAAGADAICSKMNFSEITEVLRSLTDTFDA